MTIMIRGLCRLRLSQFQSLGINSTLVRHISGTSWALGSKSKRKGYGNRRANGNVTTVDTQQNGETISPSTIQVFSDPHLAQTVRDLAVSFQKTKNAVKNLREDLEDCSFELLRQAQTNETLESAVQETTKLLKQCNEHDLQTIGETMKELEENVVYFSKLAANQENRLMDMNDNVQSALSKLAKHSNTLSGIRGEVDKLRIDHEAFKADAIRGIQEEIEKFRSENETFKAEASAAFVETRILKKELKAIKGQLAHLKYKP